MVLEVTRLPAFGLEARHLVRVDVDTPGLVTLSGKRNSHAIAHGTKADNSHFLLLCH